VKVRKYNMHHWSQTTHLITFVYNTVIYNFTCKWIRPLYHCCVGGKGQILFFSFQ